MAFDKPLYIRGFQPPRRNRLGIAAGTLFVVAILIVNYAVFFRGDGPAAPTLEQRLARPVEVKAPAAQEAVPAAPAQNRMVEGAVVRGETAAQTLTRLGLSPDDVVLAVDALSRDVDLRKMKPGQRMVLSMRPDGKLATLEYPLNETDYYEVAPGEAAWTLTRKAIPTEKETVQFACVIRGSLYDSIANCGEDTTMANLIAELLSGQVDFHNDLRRGDIVRIIVDKEHLNGRFLRFGEVHGLMFEGKLVSATAFPLRMGDTVAYYDAEGKSVDRPFLRSPLKYSRISSDYSLNRLHPVLQRHMPHRAQDYSAPKGTPVLAAGEGKVIYRGPKGANGNLLVVDHGNGFQSYYAHLSGFARGLKVGDRVSKAALIGFVGATGRATGPHLHYAVAHLGQFVHPRELSDLPGPAMPAMMEADFRATASRTLGELQALPIRGVDGSRS